MATRKQTKAIPTMMPRVIFLFSIVVLRKRTVLSSGNNAGEGVAFSSQSYHCRGILRHEGKTQGRESFSLLSRATVDEDQVIREQRQTGYPLFNGISGWKKKEEITKGKIV